MKLIWKSPLSESGTDLTKKVEHDASILNNLLTSDFSIVYRKYPVDAPAYPKIWASGEFPKNYDWTAVEAAFSSSTLSFEQLKRSKDVVLELPLFVLPPAAQTRKIRVKTFLQKNAPKLFEVLMRVKKRELFQKSETLTRSRLPLRQSFPKGTTGSNSVLVAMYWFQLGGAEKFAMDTIDWLSSQDKNVIVVADQPSEHKWISRLKDFKGKIYLISDTVPQELQSTFYKWICAQHGVKILHIHHSLSCYRSLPEIKTTFPEIKVIDTTHILELPKYPISFPNLSVQYDRFIDIHHGISNQLCRFFSDNKVAESKIIKCLLVPDPQRFKDYKKRSSKDQFVIGFLARFSEQKRPLSFLRMANLLKDDKTLRFLMCGSGELLESCKEAARKLGISDRVQFRPEVRNVLDFYDAVDLIVLPSENEGIALVSYEAMSLGIPIIIPDVGGQSELLPDWLLISPNERGLETRIAARIEELMKDRNKLASRSETLRKRVDELWEGNQLASLFERIYGFGVASSLGSSKGAEEKPKS